MGRGEIILLLVVSVIFIALLLPSVNKGRPSPRTLCVSNLKQIGLALQNYHSTYGCFPPVALLGTDGKPAHSWRVLLLPYLDYQQLYDQYRFDESWDGPHNAELAKSCPAFYRCPAHSTSGCSYLAVVGPRTAWPNDQPMKLARIQNASKTIQIVEVVDSGINWLEPRDLTVRAVDQAINGTGLGISSKHAGGANVLYCDGSVLFLENGLSVEAVQAALDVDGQASQERER